MEKYNCTYEMSLAEMRWAREMEIVGNKYELHFFSNIEDEINKKLNRLIKSKIYYIISVCRDNPKFDTKITVVLENGIVLDLLDDFRKITITKVHDETNIGEKFTLKKIKAYKKKLIGRTLYERNDSPPKMAVYSLLEVIGRYMDLGLPYEDAYIKARWFYKFSMVEDENER